MKTLVLLILVLLISSQVYAGPMIYGMGNNTCGHYVKVLEGYHQNNVNDTRVKNCNLSVLL